MLVQIIKRVQTILFELTIAPIIQHRQPYHVIDKGVRPVVESLNKIKGVETIASCHGHLGARTCAPYVYFKAPPDIAISVHKAIWLATQHSPFYWVIEGHFNAECELCFRLVSPKCDRAVHHWTTCFWVLGWQRNQLDRALIELAQHIDCILIRK